MTPELKAAFDASNLLDDALCHTLGEIDFDMQTDVSVGEDGAPYICITSEKDLSDLLPSEVAVGSYIVSVFSKPFQKRGIH